MCVLATALLLVGGAAETAWGQPCPGTYIWGRSQATRMHGNRVRLENRTWTEGPYWNYWYNYISSALYIRGSLNSSLPWGGTTPAGAAAIQSYERVLESNGPGEYYTSSYHNAYSPVCDGGRWFWASAALTDDSINIERPARPDYLSGQPRALWYLGAGITSTGNYPAQTRFTPGAANGAPESPVYVVTYGGGNRLSLSCTNCLNPTATAVGASSGCQIYDVEVKTSYNGFLSEPFYLFINRPWNLVAGTDPFHGTWVWSDGKYNGYETRVNYRTSGLCSTDAPMSGYDLNEQFSGGMVADYSGTNWTGWPASGLYVSGSDWWDRISIYNEGSPPESPAYCGFVLCIPQFRNPGQGPHTLVDHVNQAWFVGSTTPGSGARVQTNVLQRYTDSAWHTNIVTPNP